MSTEPAISSCGHSSANWIEAPIGDLMLLGSKGIHLATVSGET